MTQNTTTTEWSQVEANLEEKLHMSEKDIQEILEPTTPSGKTRRALVEAALKHFGAKGYDAASTRDIASEADTNVSSIAYHFAGKDGLRNACAQFVGATMRQVALRSVIKDDRPVDSLSPQEARERLLHLSERFLTFAFMQKSARLFINFMLRELLHPSPALDMIYSGVMGPLLQIATELWSKASSVPADSDMAKLSVFTLIGQIAYFRLAQEVVKRRMEWDEVTEDELRELISTVKFNINASLDAHNKQALKA